MKKMLGLIPLALFAGSCVVSGAHPGRTWSCGHGWGGAVLWILWIAVIVLVIYLIVRGQTFGKRETPLDILKRRYAAGEISKEEFERMKKDLEA
jgi:putative membrane protein